MKKTETFIVLRNKKTGEFLTKYKSKEQTLAYSSHYTDELSHAAKNGVEATKKQIEDFTKLANAFDCELLEVTATYELKTLDGENPEDLTDKIKNPERESFKKFLDMLANELEDD
jgi:hypothetical protein